MARLDILISSKGTSEAKLESKAANGGQAANADIVKEQAENATNNSFIRGAAIHQLMSNTIALAKSITTDNISMYGDLTGDYMEQTRIENAFKIVGGTVNFGGTVTSGGIVGGVGGAVVGTVVAVGREAYSVARTNRMYNISIVKQNIQAKFNSQRIGQILVGGGRL